MRLVQCRSFPTKIHVWVTEVFVLLQTNAYYVALDLQQSIHEEKTRTVKFPLCTSTLDSIIIFLGPTKKVL